MEYTIIGGKRQEALNHRIQDMRAKAAKKSRKVMAAAVRTSTRELFHRR
jgi:predicted Holliday junction resolvase-like endonuclease